MTHQDLPTQPAEQPLPEETGSATEILLAARLPIPATTEALLFDMDGVLLDTLTLDYEIVNQALRDVELAGTLTDERVEIPREIIRANFAYDVPKFWWRILAEVGVEPSAAQHADLVRRYDELRLSASLRVHAGVAEILTAAKRRGLKLAVVSNNPAETVATLLSQGGLLDQFDEIVGNDKPGLAKKPAPDTYLEGAQRLGVSPSACVVVEDSLLGAEAGSRAGCFTVAVATGANSYEELAGSPFTSRWVRDFA